MESSFSGDIVDAPIQYNDLNRSPDMASRVGNSKLNRSYEEDESSDEQPKKGRMTSSVVPAPKQHKEDNSRSRSSIKKVNPKDLAPNKKFKEAKEPVRVRRESRVLLSPTNSM
jgi:hypothetical protein